MDHKLRPVHALGAAIAFAVGFFFVSAVSAYADGFGVQEFPAPTESQFLQ